MNTHEIRLVKKEINQKPSATRRIIEEERRIKGLIFIKAYRAAIDANNIPLANKIREQQKAYNAEIEKQDKEIRDAYFKKLLKK